MSFSEWADTLEFKIILSTILRVTPEHAERVTVVSISWCKWTAIFIWPQNTSEVSFLFCFFGQMEHRSISDAKTVEYYLLMTTCSLSASGNTFFLKKSFNELTISSKQNGFIHFQSSNKTVLHAHFFTVTALFLFHVFQHCNVTLLVFLLLLLIRTKFKAYKLDPVRTVLKPTVICFVVTIAVILFV